MQTEIARARVEEHQLKKSLSLLEVIVYGVGIILGAGIYALIGEAAGIAGNMVWLSFVVAAIIASFSALSYAELSSLFPKCAAEYVYTKRATKSNFLAFAVGYIALLAAIITATAVAVGFGGYLQGLTGIPIIIGASVLLLLLSFLNWFGLKESAKFNLISTAIEVGGLVLIIILGFHLIGSVDLLEFPVASTNPGELFAPIFAAAAIIFFAFLGFEDLANISEETKNAKRNIPIGLLTAVAITTVIYILVAVVAVSAVPYAELGNTTEPLALVASALGGNFGAYSGTLLSIIALFATANTVLIILIVSSRIMFGMARDKSLPKMLSRLDKKRGTPIIAIMLVLIVTILLLLVGSLSEGILTTLAKLTAFGILIVFFSVNMSLIILRFTEPKIERAFKVPLSIGKLPIIPSLGMLFCIFMLTQLGMVTFFEGTSSEFALPIVLLGFILYITFIPVFLLNKFLANSTQ